MDVLLNFILFGIIEIFIILYFIKNVNMLEKVKYWHMLILCPLYCLCGYLDIPYVKQISVFIIFIIYVFILRKNIIKSTKYSTISILYLLIVETICLIPLDLFGIFDISTINNNWEKFLLFIPIRIIQIVIIKNTIKEVLNLGFLWFNELEEVELETEEIEELEETEE